MSIATETLVARARSLGIELALRGDQIHFRPRKAMPPGLLSELAAAQAEVRVLLQGLAPLPEATRTRNDKALVCLDSCSVPEGVGIGAGPETPGNPTDKTDESPAVDLMSVLSVPSALLSEATIACTGGADMGTPPGTHCWCCGGTARWRLGEGRPWVCPRCHPPERDSAGLEWAGGRDAEGRR